MQYRVQYTVQKHMESNTNNSDSGPILKVAYHRLFFTPDSTGMYDQNAYLY